jgi:prevent-host-death family protein
MKVAATEIKKGFTKYLDAAFTEPVTIQLTGKEVAVLVSIVEFNRLKEIEMKYIDMWEKTVIKAEESDSIGTEYNLKPLKKTISLKGMMNDSQITDKDIKEIKQIWK